MSEVAVDIGRSPGENTARARDRDDGAHPNGALDPGGAAVPGRVAHRQSFRPRPGLKGKTLVGGVLFLGLYTILLLGLKWSAPGYIEQAWNLPELSGGLISGIPVEELLFGFSFGMYWTGVYEHFTWSKSVRLRAVPAQVLHGSESSGAFRDGDAGPRNRVALDDEHPFQEV